MFGNSEASFAPVQRKICGVGVVSVMHGLDAIAALKSFLLSGLGGGDLRVKNLSTAPPP